MAEKSRGDKVIESPEVCRKPDGFHPISRYENNNARLLKKESANILLSNTLIVIGERENQSKLN